MNIKRILYYCIKAVNIALTAVLVLYCVVVGYIAYCNFILKTDVPRLGPVSMYIVLSESMYPHFKIDDAVFVYETDVQKLAVGDVIAFTAFEDNAPITHRITKITKSADQLEFNTKGDNNTSEDTFLTPESRVLGKIVFKFPAVGSFIQNLQEKPYSIIFPLLFVVLLQYGLNFFEKAFSDKKNDLHAEEPV